MIEWSSLAVCLRVIVSMYKLLTLLGARTFYQRTHGAHVICWMKSHYSVRRSSATPLWGLEFEGQAEPPKSRWEYRENMSILRFLYCVLLTWVSRIGLLVQFPGGALIFFVIHSYSVQTKGLVKTHYKHSHAHTRVLSMKKWVFDFLYQIGVKTTSA